MIPLKVDSAPNRIPVLTVLLILLCLAVHFGHAYVAQYGQGFVPVDFMYGLLHPGPDTLSSLVALMLSFFQHGGLLHLVGNMWYLWLFGSMIEHAVGSVRFALVYVACGVLSMVIQAASTPLSTIPVIGASGAIAGVMGACLVLQPFARIVLYIPPIFFPRVWSFLFLLLWFGLQYYSMRNAPHGGGGVAWWAHIGGFVCGALIAFELRRRGVAHAQQLRPVRGKARGARTGAQQQAGR